MMSYDYPHPVSRTYQYKKITKPLLERKRRARINRCLEELKDLMVDALETEGENISKLEKADILELTVRHLQRLQASRPSGLSTSVATGEDTSAESRWRSGFGHCAAEACRFLAALPGEAAERLARHLTAGLHSTRQMNQVQVSTKPDLVSSTIVNLEKTANFLVPCNDASSSSSDISTVSPTNLQLYSENVAKSSQSFASPSQSVVVTSTTAETTAVCDKSESSEDDSSETRDKGITSRSTLERFPASKNGKMLVVVDDEEEIDVEGVEESQDPMWRPW